MDWIWKYYGVDWAGMILAVLSLYYLGKRKKRGFLLGLLCNIAWLVFGFMTHSAANICSNLVYMGFNIHAWRKWKKNGWSRKD